MLINGHEMDVKAIANMGQLDEKPKWNGGTYDPCSLNRTLGRRERHVFSIPFPRPVRDEVLNRIVKMEDIPGKVTKKLKLSQTMGRATSFPLGRATSVPLSRATSMPKNE